MSSWLLANMDALPGVGSELVAQERLVLMQPALDTDLFPIGGAIDGSNSRDPNNPTGRVDIIRDGMPMGRITATNKWAPSIIGQLGKALAGTDTNLVLQSAAEGTELTRRIITIGAGTTFRVTGPPSAAGTVYSATATISSVGAGTGQDAVNTLVWASQPSAGTVVFTFKLADGTYKSTTAIAYNASLATLNTALDVMTGVGSGIVATGTTYVYQTLIFTYSGTGYTHLAQPTPTADVSSLTQTTAGYTCTQTTIGVPTAGTVTLSSALGVNEIQTVTITGALSAGTLYFVLVDYLGMAHVCTMAYNVTFATALAALNSSIVAELGSAQVVVTSTGAAWASCDLIFTFSGTHYTKTAQTNLVACSIGAATGPTSVATVRTQAGVNGAFVKGSLIQPLDGSQDIRSLLVTGQRTGVSVFNALLQSIDVSYPVILHSGVVRTSYILGYTGNDASTKAWIKAQLRTYGGRFIFDDDFLGTSA